jgi:hypothetical protein
MRSSILPHGVSPVVWAIAAIGAALVASAAGAGVLGVGIGVHLMRPSP